jgi:hypothetical protein
MTYKYQVENFDFQFSDTDIVNPDDCIPAGESNPHNVHAFVLHDAGFVQAVVFADCLQDAIDEAVDAKKLEQFAIGDNEMADYTDDDGRLSYLGNYGRAFDIETLDAFEIPASKWKRVLELTA